MLKKLVFIGSLVLLFVVLASSSSYAQLITDSPRRLETTKTSRSGSGGLFSKKGKSGSDKSHAKSKRSTEPHSASGSPFLSKKKSTGPRSISGGGLRSGYDPVSPRYSAGDHFEKKSAVTPRYSSRDESSKKVTITPRYSPGSPFVTGRKAKVTPRYSDKRRHFHVDERAKKENAFYNMGTSEFCPFKGKTLWKYKVDRMAQSYKTKNFKGTKVHPFVSYPNIFVADYKGDLKLKSLHNRDMHPSAKHLQANQDSELVRNSLRKWNIFWTRVNRNKAQPDAVTKKVSKPKFDRKEADIWNE